MTDKLKPPNPASEKLRSVVARMSEYDLPAELQSELDSAVELLKTYRAYDPAQDRRHKKLPQQTIAAINSEEGSIRQIARKLNLSPEVVRKYRQRK